MRLSLSSCGARNESSRSRVQALDNELRGQRRFLESLFSTVDSKEKRHQTERRWATLAAAERDCEDLQSSDAELRRNENVCTWRSANDRRPRQAPKHTTGRSSQLCVRSVESSFSRAKKMSRKSLLASQTVAWSPWLLYDCGERPQHLRLHAKMCRFVFFFKPRLARQSLIKRSASC